MQELYWGCLVGGVLFTLVTVLIGDVFGHFLHGLFGALSFDSHVLQPVVVVGGITVFGGAGVLLTQYTSIGSSFIVLLSLLSAIILSIPVYFFYVKPMQQSENSTGFSMQEIVGRLGEVTVPVPVKGYGEVLVKMGAGHTNQIAASFEGVAIEAGVRVVIVEVKDHAVYVSRYEEQ
ncbi:MAG: protease [Tumebacillaceae bacterium]